MKRASEYKQTFQIPKINSIPEEYKTLPIPQYEIEQLRARSKEKLQFSFKFFDRDHEAFNLAQTNRVCDGWFLSLFDTLKDVSNITRNELVIEKKQHYDAHEHKWDELRYKYPLDDEFLNQVECMQFRISQGRGRVHGFIIGNRFYIVWFDPHHNLYPDERYGGLKLFNKPDSCYDILDHEIFNLHLKISELENRYANLEVEYNEFIVDHENTLQEKESIEKAKNHLEEKNDIKRKKQEKYNRKLNRRKQH